MKVNNFDAIEPLLDFSEPETFYYVEVLARKKENPNRKHSKCVQRFFIDSINNFRVEKPTIKKFCRTFNARAYIGLNKRNFKQVAKRQAVILAEYREQEDYKAAKKAYHSACGQVHNQDHRIWVVDFDDCTKKHVEQTVEQIIDPLHKEVQRKPYKALKILPTPNGWHLITNPFHRVKFKKRYKKTWGQSIPGIKTDNPTVLFYERI